MTVEQPSPAPLINAPAEVKSYAVAERLNPPPPTETIDDTYTDPIPEQPTVPFIENYLIWLKLAECESGGDWQINTGNGYYGGLQFNNQSWNGAGGALFASRADLASPGEQMLVAENLLDMQGWGAWPACSRKIGLR